MDCAETGRPFMTIIIIIKRSISDTPTSGLIYARGGAKEDEGRYNKR